MSSLRCRRVSVVVVVLIIVFTASFAGAEDDQTFRKEAATLAQAGQLDGAVQEYRKALALNPKDKGLLYKIGTLERHRGNHKGAKEMFLALYTLDPDDGDALEGLSLAYLSLGEYDNARVILERWRAKSPNSTYVLGLLARAYSHLRRLEDLRKTYAEIVQADPHDLIDRQRLDDLERENFGGYFPTVKYSQSAGPEGLGFPNPQRIDYEGSYVEQKIREPINPSLNLIGSVLIGRSAQRNETQDFSYFDIFEQTYGVGVEVKPSRDLELKAEAGPSHYSDIIGSAVGQTDFVHADMSGKLYLGASNLQFGAERSPKFLPGALTNRYFAFLTDYSGHAALETPVGDWTWRAKTSLDTYSEGTNVVDYSLLGTREFGNNLLQPRFSHGQEEFYGATPQGNVGVVNVDSFGLRYRRLVEDTYRLTTSYDYGFYSDNNSLGEIDGELTGWWPWWKELSATYHTSYKYYGYQSPNYLSTSGYEHWVGPTWRHGYGGGFWTTLRLDHGFLYDIDRDTYQSNAASAEAEWYWKDKASLDFLARGAHSDLNDDSYYLRLQGRYSF